MKFTKNKNIILSAIITLIVAAVAFGAYSVITANNNDAFGDCKGGCGCKTVIINGEPMAICS